MSATARPLRVIGYVRLSDYRADDASTSPQRQREQITATCLARGWQLVDIIADLDVSGSDRGLRLQRPGLVQIRARYAEADVLLFTKLDRLARNVTDFRAIAEDAEANGVALVSIDDNIDLTSASGKFFATILAAFAEMEAATIRERVLKGNAKARELGRFMGGVPPYGYRAVPHPSGEGRALAIDPAEAAVVRELAAAVLGGATVYRATRELNERGVLSKTGKEWSTQAVRQVLTSPRIVGRRTHGGEVVSGANGLPLQVDDPVLSVETWHRVRARLAPTPASSRRSPNPARLLSGLVTCSRCNGRMNPGPTGGDGRLSYRCSTASKGRECSGVSVRCEPLEAWLVETFLDRFGPLPLTHVIEIAPEEPAALVEVRAAMNAAANAMIVKDANVPALVDRLAALKGEEARLEAAPREDRFEVIEEGTFAEVWHRDEDVERRRNLLADAVQEISISPGKAGRRPFNPERVEVRWAEGSSLSDYGTGESRGPAIA
ncbi:recombinase family protein [Nocardioides conyzicola]|uniref:Recombinase family protein n=1 Tax=Nocardioides conyzicola TaxID=1651781 RepID=A0ABP8WZ37_9ACTN